MIPQTPEEAAALTVASPLVHFTSFAKIEDKAGQLVKVEQVHPFQHRIYQAYEWLMATDQPVRIIAAPKPRQSGGSTAVGHICYHHTRRFRVHGMMMADEYDRTKKIWEMFKRFADNDAFEGQWKSRAEINTEEARFHYRDENGALRKAIWEHETANDSKAGASGTRRILWFSECMRYRKEGDASDDKVIGNALNSLPYSPGTVVFLESTAEGASGYAYKIWCGAVTLQEHIQGKLGNGWVKVFCAWHECPDYALEKGRAENVRWFDDSDPEFEELRDAEEAGKMRYGWTAEQIAWRRMKIVGEQQGALFDRDYPDCEETAFRASTDRRFEERGLARLEVMVREHDRLSAKDKLGPTDFRQKAQIGEIDEGIGLLPRMIWRADNSGPFWVVEPPMPGFCYVGFCDPARGRQSEGSRVRDGCSAGIMRFATTHGGVMLEDETVAFLHGYNYGPVHWDNDIVAECLSRLLLWYGDCPVQVEANSAGVEVIRLLQQAGRTVIRRRKRDYKNPGKLLDVVGFDTSDGSKQEWVGALAKGIREQTLNCRYAPAVRQISVFTLDESGKGCAPPNDHDDHVTGCGLGLISKFHAKMLNLRFDPLVGLLHGGRPVENERVGGAWS